MYINTVNVCKCFIAQKLLSWWLWSWSCSLYLIVVFVVAVAVVVVMVVAVAAVAAVVRRLVLHTYQFACCSPSLFWFGSVFADRFCNHEWRQSLKQLSTCWQGWGKSYQKASIISQCPVIFWTWICCHVTDVNIFPLGRLFLLGDFEPSPVAVEAVLESSKSRTCAVHKMSPKVFVFFVI